MLPTVKSSRYWCASNSYWEFKVNSLFKIDLKQSGQFKRVEQEGSSNWKLMAGVLLEGAEDLKIIGLKSTHLHRHKKRSFLDHSFLIWLHWAYLYFSTLFCIPPKTGCTSYRRAFGSQFTKEFLRNGDHCKKKPCYNASVVNDAREDLGDNSEVPGSDLELFMNEKSRLVGKQQLSPNEIGWPG